MDQEVKFFTQNEARINGRGVWQYLISCPIGDISIVEHENTFMSLEQDYIGFSYQTAEKKFNQACRRIINGIHRPLPRFFGYELI